MNHNDAQHVPDLAADRGGHRYAVVSTHRTSEGRIAYSRCTCGRWRVQRHPLAEPTVIEAVVDPSNRTDSAATPPSWTAVAGTERGLTLSRSDQAMITTATTGAAIHPS